MRKFALQTLQPDSNVNFASVLQPAKHHCAIVWIDEGRQIDGTDWQRETA
jgi:hypothetical protein